MARNTELRLATEGATRWDWWPLARLLTVLGAFGSLASLSSHSLDLGSLQSLPGRVFEVFTFFTLLSFALAHLYLMLIMLPLYALVTLNDTFYDLSVWVIKTVLRPRSKGAVAAAGLCGELLLFGAVAALVIQATGGDLGSVALVLRSPFR